MSPKRIGPLFLMALAGLLLAAVWTTASAEERWVPTISSDPETSFGSPIYNPTSGEPDVGGTPAPPRSKSDGHAVSNRAVAQPPWSQLPPWVRLVMRTWSVWFPGLS